MKPIALILSAILLAGTGSWLLAAQRQRQRQGRFGGGGGDDDDSSLLPTNTGEKAEWTFARYHYGAGGEGFYFRGFRRWAADYPKSDRQFVDGVRRLTRIDSKVTEQVVDGTSDEVFNWPWIFVEDAGAWSISKTEAD